MEARIHPSAVLDPSVIVGNDSIIGACTVIMKDVKIGHHTIVGPHNVIEAGAKIGNYCTMQPFCVIARDTLIEDNVFIGPHYSCSNDKHIPEGEHGTSPNKKPFQAFPITIKKGAKLGTRVTVAPDITIGENARIDMCSFITKDVKPNDHIRSDKIIVAKSFKDKLLTP